MKASRRSTVFAASIILIAIAPRPTEAQHRVPPSGLDPSRVGRGFAEFSDMMASAVFREADADRNGVLTRQEASRAGARFGIVAGSDPRAFAALDLNGDGVIVLRELADALRMVQARTSKGRRPF